jgi:hypothetical protein
MAMDQRIQDMCLLVYPRHLRDLVMVPFFLALTLAFPANAQTNSDPSTKSTGTVSAQARSMPGLASPNPATAKAASNPITLSTKPVPTSEASKSAGTQPLPNPATKKAGSAVLINIDKTKQKMTVFFRWGGKI